MSDGRTITQRIAALIPTGGRLRWRMAEAVDKRTDACWADLVDFALWSKKARDDNPEGEPTMLPEMRERGARCKAQEGCYCGKFVGGKRREATP